jgi:hydrogenase maturation protease
MKTIVLGLGNDILCDDGVGIHVARELKKVLADRKDISVAEASLAGLGLLDLLAGYQKAIVIDAIQTREGKPGQVYRLNSNDLTATRHTASTHNVNFASALELGRKLGLALPHQIIIFAIEVTNIDNFGEKCMPKVRQAIPACIKLVMQELGESHRAQMVNSSRNLITD